MDYVGTKAAAEMLKLSQATVCSKCRKGEFVGAEQDSPGHPWRIPKKEVEQMAAERGITIPKEE